MKTSTISARIDPILKQGAERIFRQLGSTVSQAITLFYRQVEMQHGLSFSVHIPNEATHQALEDAQTVVVLLITTASMVWLMPRTRCESLA